MGLISLWLWVTQLMMEILHYLKDPKLWELWYIMGHAGFLSSTVVRSCCCGRITPTSALGPMHSFSTGASDDSWATTTQEMASLGMYVSGVWDFGICIVVFEVLGFRIWVFGLGGFGIWVFGFAFEALHWAALDFGL